MVSNVPPDDNVNDIAQEKRRGIIGSIPFPELFDEKTMMFMFSFSAISQFTRVYFSRYQVDCKSVSFQLVPRFFW